MYPLQKKIFKVQLIPPPPPPPPPAPGAKISHPNLFFQYAFTIFHMIEKKSELIIRLKGNTE